MNTIHANPGPAVAIRAADTTTNSGLPSSQGLNDMFLQLLVAQLQNQSPLNPMDPTQFVGQLAQFSELSEVTQINQLLQKNFPAIHHAQSADGYSVAGPLLSSAVAAARAVGSVTEVVPAHELNHSIQGVF